MPALQPLVVNRHSARPNLTKPSNIIIPDDEGLPLPSTPPRKAWPTVAPSTNAKRLKGTNNDTAVDEKCISVVSVEPISVATVDEQGVLAQHLHIYHHLSGAAFFLPLAADARVYNIGQLTNIFADACCLRHQDIGFVSDFWLDVSDDDDNNMQSENVPSSTLFLPPTAPLDSLPGASSNPPAVRLRFHHVPVLSHPCPHACGRCATVAARHNWLQRCMEASPPDRELRLREFARLPQLTLQRGIEISLYSFAAPALVAEVGTPVAQLAPGFHFTRPMEVACRGGWRHEPYHCVAAIVMPELPASPPLTEPHAPPPSPTPARFDEGFKSDTEDLATLCGATRGVQDAEQRSSCQGRADVDDSDSEGECRPHPRQNTPDAASAAVPEESTGVSSKKKKKGRRASKRNKRGSAIPSDHTARPVSAEAGICVTPHHHHGTEAMSRAEAPTAAAVPNNKRAKKAGAPCRNGKSEARRRLAQEEEAALAAQELEASAPTPDPHNGTETALKPRSKRLRPAAPTPGTTLPVDVDDDTLSNLLGWDVVQAHANPEPSVTDHLNLLRIAKIMQTCAVMHTCRVRLEDPVVLLASMTRECIELRKIKQSLQDYSLLTVAPSIERAHFSSAQVVARLHLARLQADTERYAVHLGNCLQYLVEAERSPSALQQLLCLPVRFGFDLYARATFEHLPESHQQALATLVRPIVDVHVLNRFLSSVDALDIANDGMLCAEARLNGLGSAFIAHLWRLLFEGGDAAAILDGVTAWSEVLRVVVELTLPHFGSPGSFADRVVVPALQLVMDKVDPEIFTHAGFASAAEANCEILRRLRKPHLSDEVSVLLITARARHNNRQSSRDAKALQGIIVRNVADFVREEVALWVALYANGVAR